MAGIVLKQLFTRAVAAQRAGRGEEAVRLWRSLLLIHGDYLPAYHNLGLVLRQLGRIAESEAVLRTGLERHPDSPDIRINLARTLCAWGNRGRTRAEALAHIQAAVDFAPDTPFVHYAKGRLLAESDTDPADESGDGGDVGEDGATGPADDASDTTNPSPYSANDAAMAAFEAALALDPAHLPSLIALARLHRARAADGEAVSLLKRAVRIAPDHPGAHVQFALALLAAGRLPAGFREYEWRLRDPAAVANAAAAGAPDLPRWQGENLGDGRLLIICDGGRGEIFQFVRLLRRIERRALVLEVPGELRTLLRAGRLAEEVIAAGEPRLPTDFWVPLNSLPHILKIRAGTIPAQVPYLYADATRLSRWRERLEANLKGPVGIRIGIVWSGGERAFESGRRHISLRDFAPLAALDGAALISLQKGDGRQEIANAPFGIVDLSSDLDEGEDGFLDSVALMHSLDLIVGPPTALLHLAGALGRPVFAALPPDGDWHLGWQDQDVSPWYPTMRLFRKRRGSGWQKLFQEMAMRWRQEGAIRQKRRR